MLGLLLGGARFFTARHASAAGVVSQTAWLHRPSSPLSGVGSVAELLSAHSAQRRATRGYAQCGFEIDLSGPVYPLVVAAGGERSAKSLRCRGEAGGCARPNESPAHSHGGGQSRVGTRLSLATGHESTRARGQSAVDYPLARASRPLRRTGPIARPLPCAHSAPPPLRRWAEPTVSLPWMASPVARCPSTVHECRRLLAPAGPARTPARPPLPTQGGEPSPLLC